MSHLGLSDLARSTVSTVKEFPQFEKISQIRKKTKEVIAHEQLFKDKVFTPEDWIRHKTWHRFEPQFKISFRAMYAFAGPVVFQTTWAAFVCIYHGVLEKHGAPKFWDEDSALWEPINLASFCLALLLVHRTSTTYARWLEARTIWGDVLNLTRNLIRMCVSPCGFPSEERALLEMMARCTIAMPYCLRAHLKFEQCEEALESLLPQDEVQFIVNSQQPCLRVAQLASSIVGKVMAERGFEIERNRMDEEILQYVNLVGACERIYKTPNPHAFNRHLAHLLNVWLFLLPIALWPVHLQTGWATIFVQLVLCYLTIGTENISIQIEEPFAIMPLMEFCQGMESSVIDIMDSCLTSDKLVGQIRSSKRCLGYKRVETVVKVDLEGSKSSKSIAAHMERIRRSLDRFLPNGGSSAAADNSARY